MNTLTAAQPGYRATAFDLAVERLALWLLRWSRERADRAAERMTGSVPRRREDAIRVELSARDRTMELGWSRRVL